MEISEIITEIESLRIEHQVCSGFFCNCHKSACVCGADQHNAKIDKLISALINGRIKMETTRRDDRIDAEGWPYHRNRNVN